MSTTVPTIVVIVVHLIGFVIYGLNACYIKLTSGSDHPEDSGTQDLDELKSQRCCKLRSKKAMNLLVIYVCVLVVLDFILAFVFLQQDEDNRMFSITPTVIWIMPGMTYMFLFVFLMPIGLLCTYTTTSHIGPIHAFNAYDFLHFFLFWASFLFMITCAGADCSALHEDLQNLAGGYAGIIMAWCYLMLFGGSCINIGFFKLGRPDKVKTPDEVIRMIKEEMQRTPSIKWELECGHTVTTRNKSRWVKLHSDTRTYSYSSDNVKRFLKPADPTPDMFQRRFTKLVIIADMKPGDLQQKRDMESARKRFKQSHKGHDSDIQLSTEDETVVKYLVKRDPHDVVPQRFYSKTWYWLSAVFALSMPYRWYLYCTMGHIKVKIRRRVYGLGTEDDVGIEVSAQPRSQLSPYNYRERQHQQKEAIASHHTRPHYDNKPVSQHSGYSRPVPYAPHGRYYEPQSHQPPYQGSDSYPTSAQHHNPSNQYAQHYHQQEPYNRPRQSHMQPSEIYYEEDMAGTQHIHDPEGLPSYEQVGHIINEPESRYIPWQFQYKSHQEDSTV